jgi:hypothetical protein
MNITKLIKDRDSGSIQVRAIRNYGFELELILAELGLARKPDWLEEIDVQQGTEIIEAILWKELAYNDELMDRTLARSYAEEFMNSFVESDCRLYSNGKWQTYHESNAFSFNPMTEATFNAGVLVIHREYAAMLWVEDED